MESPHCSLLEGVGKRKESEKMKKKMNEMTKNSLEYYVRKFKKMQVITRKRIPKCMRCGEQEFVVLGFRKGKVLCANCKKLAYYDELETKYNKFTRY
jgi:hypothetical protein